MKMKIFLFSVFLFPVLLFLSCSVNKPVVTGKSAIVINHNYTGLDAIPSEWITKAKEDLIIAYGHTSHGSQIVTGMQGLINFKGLLYSFNETGQDSALELIDTPFEGAYDLGNPNFTAWATATRQYLDAHPEVNVVVWSWCGEVSDADSSDIATYLNLTNGLEFDYPSVRFVYMTGHLNGTGLDGNLHLRNNQIRNYCTANKKILYDFEDIESYDPDGNYFGDKLADDGCNYDSDGDGIQDANWAQEWENAHPGEWYDCTAAHTEPLNANQKAYAAWSLWARLAGWGGI